MSDTPEMDAVFLIEGNWNTLAKQLKRERDEAREALMKIEEIFVDGCDTFADRIAMGEIARAALEGGK